MHSSSLLLSLLIPTSTIAAVLRPRARAEVHITAITTSGGSGCPAGTFSGGPDTVDDRVGQIGFDAFKTTLDGEAVDCTVTVDFDYIVPTDGNAELILGAELHGFADLDGLETGTSSTVSQTISAGGKSASDSKTVTEHGNNNIKTPTSVSFAIAGEAGSKGHAQATASVSASVISQGRSFTQVDSVFFSFNWS